MGKYWLHFKYTCIHKFWVMVYCFEIGLYRRGILHDLSKFRLSEFKAYADYFFEPYTTNERKAEKKYYFDIAWLKHQNRNPHHWHHFISVDYEGEIKVLDMPPEFVQEMVCDWRAAGKAKGTANGSIEGAKLYYLQHKDHMRLSVDTRCMVEDLLHV